MIDGEQVGGCVCALEAVAGISDVVDVVGASFVEGDAIKRMFGRRVTVVVALDEVFIVRRVGRRLN